MACSIGVLLIIFGIVIHSGKKFMMHGMVYQIFSILLFLGSTWGGQHMIVQIFPVIWLLFLSWNVRGRHVIYNVKKCELVELIHRILNKNKISYEDYEGKIILSEWYNDTKVVTGFCKSEVVKVYSKEIKISGESEVSLDLTDLKNTEVYEEIFNEIKLGLDEFSNSQEFSYGGVSVILMGLLIVGIDIGHVYGIFKR